jgi:hypothetical protein
MPDNAATERRKRAKDHYSHISGRVQMTSVEERHQLVDPKEIQVDRQPEALQVGVAPLTVPPNPDYNGYRVKSDDQPQIYLVLFGLRSWIQNPVDYNHLFRDWTGVLRFPRVQDLDATIPLGNPLTLGVRLAKGTDSAPVYLITNNVRMWVTSPAAMDKYWFAWNQIVPVPDEIISSISLGPSLS